LLPFIVIACDSDEPQKATDTPSQMEVEPAETVPETPEATSPETETVPPESEAAQEATEQEQPAEAQAMTGEQVFKKHCMACHMTGAANAPRVGDVEAWAPRIAKGMDALLMSAINGVPNTAMPPGGTCVSCSEQELQAAIEFMIAQSQ